MYGGNNKGNTSKSLNKFLYGRFVFTNRKAKPHPTTTEIKPVDVAIIMLLIILFKTAGSKMLLKLSKDILLPTSIEPITK